MWCQPCSVRRRKKRRIWIQENVEERQENQRAKKRKATIEDACLKKMVLKKMVNKTISGRIWQGKQWEQNAGWNNDKTQTSRQRAVDAIC